MNKLYDRKHKVIRALTSSCEAAVPEDDGRQTSLAEFMQAVMETGKEDICPATIPSIELKPNQPTGRNRNFGTVDTCSAQEHANSATFVHRNSSIVVTHDRVHCTPLNSLTYNSIKSVFSSPFLPRRSCNEAGWERACPRVGVRVPDKFASKSVAE